MYVDLVGRDVDALDQRCQESTLAWSWHLAPALADLRGARDQPALRCRIGKPRRLIDAAGVAKPLAHSAAHELLYLAGWNAQPGRPLGLILGDQRARDIVAVTHALINGRRRRHSGGSSHETSSRKSV